MARRVDECTWQLDLLRPEAQYDSYIIETVGPMRSRGVSDSLIDMTVKLKRRMPMGTGCRG
jgi:hypothetical protein